MKNQWRTRQTSLQGVVIRLHEQLIDSDGNYEVRSVEVNDRTFLPNPKHHGVGEGVFATDAVSGLYGPTCEGCDE